MESLILILYILLVITLVRTLLSILRSSKPSPRLPPGPVPLPVIGSLLKLGGKPHKSLAELAKLYGPIMSLKLGQKTVVVISSPALAREVLQKQDLAFSTRSVPNALHAHGHNKYSVAWLPVSDQWRSLRKALNSNIFSGKRIDASQNLRRQKVQELIEYAGKCCREGVAVDIGNAAFKTSLNLISNTVFSIDMADPTQDSVQQFRHLIWQIMLEVGKPNLVDYFPILDKIDPQGITRRLKSHFGDTIQLIGRLIDDRLELRRLGKRIDASQNLRRQKVQELIEYAGKCCREGVAVDIGNAAFKTSLNLISNTVFSIDMADPTQDSVQQFRHLIWQIMLEVGKPNLVDYFPILDKIDPQGITRRLKSHFGDTIQLIGRLIDERLELRRLGMTRAESDVIDILLNIIEENGEINRNHIKHLCLVCLLPFPPSSLVTS
ncbi:hypothetical protein RHSIM_RhsimUnG0070300 [Rhododendron simsii]|uniref:Uncharacterized protein n=1 Tax=Rhododendron simsii TaxID=118357 RepID=A0A834FZ11_RHOSS|nr:hypothetical protein RHSIM_RhsimUnG0070300 [Rhododendron simsii]